MVPVRLTILLLLFVLLLLLVLGNPVQVPVNFLFYSEQTELYKVMIASMLLGIVGTIIYTGHIKSIRRLRDRVRGDSFRR